MPLLQAQEMLEQLLYISQQTLEQCRIPQEGQVVVVAKTRELSGGLAYAAGVRCTNSPFRETKKKQNKKKNNFQISHILYVSVEE